MENRKNLFIEINLPKQEEDIQSLLNNWTKPIPQQYHLINSPALNYHIATMPNNNPVSQNREQFFDERCKEKTKLQKRNKDRDKYRKMRQQLSFLEEFLRQFKTLHQSQLLAYKQTLLVRYLSSFINEICIECHEKGQFFKHIWNTLIKIFEELFSRIVAQSKIKEKKYLKEEIDMHSCYQEKIQSIGKENYTLKESDLKYQNVIKEMMNNISNLNQQIKATRALYDKSVTTLRELTQRYQEMKGQYMDALINGLPGTMTRYQAQNLINDKETLLFAKQISRTDAKIKCRPKKQRVAKIITNQLDVDLIMQEIEAEQCSFQIDEQEKKVVRYVNQKVQTQQNGIFEGENMGVQCSYSNRMEDFLIRDKSAQTDSENRVYRIDEITQTEQSIFNQLKFTMKTAYSMDILSKGSAEMYQIKKSRGNNQENNLHSSYLQLRQSDNPLQDQNFKETNQNIQQQKSSEEDQEEEEEIMLAFKKKDSRGRESKMFKVGESKGTRGSKIYFSKTIKTQGSAPIKIQPSKSLIKDTKQKRMSQFLILQNLRQSTLKSLSQFKKNNFLNHTFSQKLRQEFIEYQSKGHFSIINSINQVMVQRNIQFHKQNLEVNYSENLHLSEVNAQIQDRYNCQQLLVQINKRVIGTIMNISKCLKVVGEVFKMGRKFIEAGYYSINLITLTEDYLSALQGKVLARQSREKKLLQFFRSCSTIYNDNYIIRNYFLLCGIQFPQLSEKMLKMNKISIDGLNRRSEAEKQIRLSNINFNYLKKQKEGEQYIPLAKYMYSSEVIFYFDLLYSANCSQNKEDPTKFYTTSDKLFDFLPSVKKYYKNDQQLYNQMILTINSSVKEYNSQTDTKLNIFKCQQIILQKVLMQKYKITNQYLPILKYHNMNQSRDINKEFIQQILTLFDLTYTEYIITLDIMTKYYRGGKTIEDLMTAIIIEGFQINLKPLQYIQKQYKSTIIRKLMMVKPNSTIMINNMIDAINKKSLKKPEFHLLLKHFWAKSSQSLLEELIGDNLLSIYMLTLPTSAPIQSPQNYHSQIHHLFQ